MKRLRKKILYIEDDLATRHLVCKVLAHPDFDILEAGSGIEGLQLAEKMLPDLILLDINLPDISGRELATKLRSHPVLKFSIIIALTGTNSPYARELSLVAGCDGYIEKPIDTTAFTEQIREFLDGKREAVPETDRSFYQQQYQEGLVDRLAEKVEQLQFVNHELIEKSDKLKTYSQKLENLLGIINTLQLSSTVNELRQTLVTAICEKLGFDRCAFLSLDNQREYLEVTQSYGFSQKAWGTMRSRFEFSAVHRLFDDQQITLISTLDEIPDNELRCTLETIATRQFALGILGTPTRKRTQLITHENIHQFFGQVEPITENGSSLDFESVNANMQEYLSSNLLNFDGYLFVDNQHTYQPIYKYDLKLLQTLLHSATLIYQNLRLRERLKELFIKAEQDAITDHLTRLYNFRYFTQQLAREKDRAERHNIPFSLLMLDIDYFKVYNDTLGHQAGDEVLQKVATLLMQNTRSSDFIARYGGEEFVIICPEMDKNGGQQIAEKLCKIIADTPFPHEKELPTKAVTISIGVAAYPADSRDGDELIQCADSALYSAKRNGRNQVQLY